MRIAISVYLLSRDSTLRQLPQQAEKKIETIYNYKLYNYVQILAIHIYLLYFCTYIIVLS